MSPEIRALLEDLLDLGVTVPVLPVGLRDLQERARHELRTEEAGGKDSKSEPTIEHPAGFLSTSPFEDPEMEEIQKGVWPSALQFRLLLLRGWLRERRTRGGNC